VIAPFKSGGKANTISFVVAPCVGVGNAVRTPLDAMNSADALSGGTFPVKVKDHVAGDCVSIAPLAGLLVERALWALAGCAPNPAKARVNKHATPMERRVVARKLLI
jgi:hypothetical protein